MKNQNPSQFFHYETYAIDKPPKKTGGLKKVSKGMGKQQHEKSNVSGVCGEAQRLEEFSTHVEHVEEPILLFGIAPTDVFKQIDRWIKNEDLKKSNGRHPSKKESVLVAGVVSYPEKLGIDALADQEFIKWTESVQSFLAKTYGEALQCVILHLDEGNPHLHFFAVNKPVLDVWNPIEGISCTHDVEKKLVSENGGREWRKNNGRVVIDARNDALKSLQTLFFTEVSQHHGHKRDIGARTRRLKLSPATARIVSDSLNKANELMEKNEAQELRLNVQKEGFVKKEEVLERGKLMLKNHLAALAEDEIEAKGLLDELAQIIKDAYKRKDFETIKDLEPKLAKLRERFEKTFRPTVKM